MSILNLPLRDHSAGLQIPNAMLLAPGRPALPATAAQWASPIARPQTNYPEQWRASVTDLKTVTIPG